MFCMEDGWLRPMDLFGLPSSILIHMERCFVLLVVVLVGCFLFICLFVLTLNCFSNKDLTFSSFDFKLKLIIQQKETYLLTRELLFQGECLACGSCSSALFWRSRSISMDELTSLH